MKFEAEITLRVVVAFDADVESLDLSAHLSKRDPETGKQAVSDRIKYHRALKRVEEQRVAAAKKADRELAKTVKGALDKVGKVSDLLVSEIREVGS